jgi:hypothetical protein
MVTAGCLLYNGTQWKGYIFKEIQQDGSLEC